MLDGIKSFKGYPKLRQIAKLVPSLSAYKLNVVIRFLERSGTILIDGDGCIIWTRAAGPEMGTIGELAELSPEVKEILKKSDDGTEQQ